ncbi:hypothetical protein HORM4_740010 [Vibrio harveyi]|nr:hypothetical protein HORM4_740010 [Vibrio harveyi]
MTFRTKPTTNFGIKTVCYVDIKNSKFSYVAYAYKNGKILLVNCMRENHGRIKTTRVDH